MQRDTRACLEDYLEQIGKLSFTRNFALPKNKLDFIAMYNVGIINKRAIRCVSMYPPTR